MSEKLHNIAKMWLPVTGYSDALGASFEGGAAQKPGSVSGLQAIDTKIVGRREAGTTTDDTHLAAVTMRALTEAGYDRAELASWYTVAYQATKGSLAVHEDLLPDIVSDEHYESWGPTTRQSVARMQADKSLSATGEYNAVSNGVLTRLGPLVLLQIAQGLNSFVTNKQVKEFTTMTHNSSPAVVASMVHARTLQYLISNEVTDPREIYLRAIHNACRWEERDYSRNEVSRALLTLKDEAISGNVEISDIAFALDNKSSFTAAGALARVYAGFVANPEFPSGTHRLVELGGDADTVAVLHATMALARSQDGTLTLPADYHKIRRARTLEQISHRFVETALGDVDTAAANTNRVSGRIIEPRAGIYAFVR